LRLAHRICRGSRRARRHLEGRRSVDRAHATLPDAIGARRTTRDYNGRGRLEPIIRQTSPATSFARTVYSCSFMAAGFAEIKRYESLITIFSLTFWRNRITDGKPFCEIRYSRPSSRTAAFPPSEANSEMADAMSTKAVGSAMAMSFPF